MLYSNIMKGVDFIYRLNVLTYIDIKKHMDFFVNSTLPKSGTPILQLFTLPTIIKQSRVHLNVWT